jgi:hypothetical protein
MLGARTPTVPLCLVGMFIGPALTVGADYLFWLFQPTAGGEGG